MTTAILLPTLNRPHRIEPVLEDIRSHTTLPYRIYWAASDAMSVQILHARGEWVLDDSDDMDRRYVTRMNKLAAMIDDDVEYLYFNSDDMAFHHNWLEEAVAALDSQPGAEFAITNDLRNPNGTQAFMRHSYLDRAVFDAPGNVFHSGYVHNFADTEQFATAFRRRVAVRAPLSIVEHRHPLFQTPNSLPWDETYRGAMTGWAHDETLFNARMARLAEAVP